MNTPEKILTERTNFKGDRSETCPHCGDQQEKHKITYGPFDGVVHEHRMPCEPEKAEIQKEHNRTVYAAKTLILIIWILVPLAYLILSQFSKVVGWIAFSIGLIQLGIVTIKHFGNPDKWIPGYKKKQEKESEEAHFIWHCRHNPEGFARLRDENFRKDEEKEV
jgi:hypothetical protein